MCKNKIKFINCVITTLLMALICACGSSNKHKLGMFHGRVIDIDTGRPIEKAVAHVTYQVSTSWMGSGITYNMAVRETLTDANGEYFIPEEIAIIDTRFSVDFKGRLQIFKPGYGYVGISCTQNLLQKIFPNAYPYPCPVEEKKYITWELSKLKTKEERKQRLDWIDHPYDVPQEDQVLLLQTINEERYYLGYDLLSVPKGYTPMRNPPIPDKPSQEEIKEVKQTKRKCKPSTHVGVGKGSSKGGAML